MKPIALAAFAAAALISGAANAAIYDVFAQANSSSGGTGVATLTLASGENFTVSVDPGDLWSAGPLPRWSNANGLTGNLLATGTDDSGETAGTLIGQDFGLLNQNGLSAAFGSLVGELGGVYQVLGTSFSGPAWNAGTLHLYYWDSNNGDNADSIAVSVANVPEPATWTLAIVGFGMAGALLRRQRRTLATV
jgi:hypothetical protein